ncbi:MAG: glycerol-3-phosphate 1-O-acyltransferase PlsY [Candidatus Cloacimonadia bacterium]
MSLAKIIFSIVIAYILGSIPFGFILTRITKHIDIRQYGSKNIGTTNVFRVAGPGLAIMVFICDFLKGFFAVQIGRWLLQMQNIQTIEVQIVLSCVGIAAILGHMFPIFLRLSGGKGVATGAGVLLNILPLPLLFAFLAFLIVLLISRIVSLGSLAAAIVLFITELIINIPEFDELPYLILTGIIMILLIFAHKPNIQRLKHGEEKKLW